MNRTPPFRTLVAVALVALLALAALSAHATTPEGLVFDLPVNVAEGL